MNRSCCNRRLLLLCILVLRTVTCLSLPHRNEGNSLVIRPSHRLGADDLIGSSIASVSSPRRWTATSRRQLVRRERYERSLTARFSSSTNDDASGVAAPGWTRIAAGGAVTKTISARTTTLSRWCQKHFFLVGMVVALVSARLFPALGRNGGILQPERFIGQYGVTIIFLLSGLSLPLRQMQDALANVKLNVLIQCITFAVWPLVMAGLMQLYSGVTSLGGAGAGSLLPRPLLDGLMIVSCLPTTVNMCVILTSAAGGNVAASLTNAVFSNLAGIFITPALVYRYFAAVAAGNGAAPMALSLPFMDLMMKLSQKVLLPVVIGQVLRASSPILTFYNQHATFFKRTQEVILLSILWNAFCTAISSPMGLALNLQGWLTFLTLIPVLHGAALTSCFFLFSRVLRFEPDNVVAAMFCASQKTLAFGLPLIHTMFSGSPHLASYCAPIMLAHPVQLIMGSLLLPRLQRYTSAARK